LKEFVLTEARTARMKEVYEQERVAREAAGLTMREETTSETERLTSIKGASSAPVEVEPRAEPECDAEEPTRLSDPRIVEITRQIEALTLMIQANQERKRVIARSPNGVVDEAGKSLKGFSHGGGGFSRQMKEPPDKEVETMMTTMDSMTKMRVATVEGLPEGETTPEGKAIDEMRRFEGSRMLRG
jgi:hypothetical protein